MALELRLVFPDPHQVTVQSPTGTTQPLPFTNPLTAQDLKAIRWYLETYSAQYTAEEDDQQAQAIEAKLPQWGTALFEAALGNFAAQAAFMNFYRQRQQERRLIIGASHPDILALPWELLHVPQGSYVFNSNPRITVQRQFNSTGGFNVPECQSQERVRILFIISRPQGAGFIDPRSDAQAVLAALEKEGRGRFEVEFLRPATLKALRDRLDDTRLPRIDIIHFDGHGVYDATGSLFEEARRHQGLSPTRQSPQDAAEMGYLLFEDEVGDRAIVSAEKLAALLNEQTVALVVLSACQSAMVGSPKPTAAEADEAADPTAGVMGSVAARLTHGGIPAVLAMTHSVLVTTTEALFGQFYQNLGRGQGMGEALDNARRHLFFNPDRGTRLRGQQQEVTLQLQDWFLPALYQAGADTPLLTENLVDDGDDRRGERLFALPVDGSNLPEIQETGFWGRSRELWQIERAFVGGTRRLTIWGFGGQGKTYLAVEAGRWLHQTGMFERVCFVDYAAYQGQDPVSYAVSTLATVLNASLLDAAAATAHLGQTPTLVILDNLEALKPEPQRQLLDAAKAWSAAGHSRVLLTTRQPDFHHADYKTEGSRQHIALPLRGLGSETYPNDALAYFRALWALPPAATTPTPDRAALVKLFAMVDFHPLSIGLLGRQLKERRIAEVGQRLAELLTEYDNPLVASLQLSLDRLDDQVRQWLPKLGVFQGGAMELDLLAITEITAAEWQPIRAQLEHTGLIQAEYLLSINPPYLKFHPTLAPVLWPQLSPEAQAALHTRHRQRYYQLSGYLYHEGSKNPHAARAIARRELPNLMQAVNRAIAAADGDAVDFGTHINQFLDYFGLSKDRENLATQLQQLQGAAGSQAWFLARSNQGEALWAAGRAGEALALFTEVLQGLGETPSYERCMTLTRMGRCLAAQGQATQAAVRYRTGIAETVQLEQSDGMKRQRGVMQTDLGDVLTAMGDYAKARDSYEASLAIFQELDDDRQEAVMQGQLGTLAMVEGKLAEAQTRYQATLATFQWLGEPASEAVMWHQLGMVYEEANQWEAAEQHYREAARIREGRGDLAGAAQTWHQLALVNNGAGRVEAAIALYEKAIATAKQTDDRFQESRSLSNLANLLQSQPNPSPADLSTARSHAEAALAILQTLDSAAAEIWKIYIILAQISEQQGQGEQARAYRQQARQAKATFAGIQHELRQHSQLIADVVMAILQPDQQAQLAPILQQHESGGWTNLVTAIRYILAGERDEVTLVDPLDPDDSMIVSAIFQGIADPSTLQTLLGDE